MGNQVMLMDRPVHKLNPGHNQVGYLNLMKMAVLDRKLSEIERKLTRLENQNVPTLNPFSYPVFQPSNPDFQLNSGQSFIDPANDIRLSEAQSKLKKGFVD